MKISSKIGEIAFVCSASLLAVSVALNIVGEQNAMMINSALNIVPYTLEQTGEPEGNTEYFKKTYSSAQELKSAYEQLCYETESEGVVLLKNQNNALPLAQGSRVSLFAQGSSNLNYATSGSSGTSSTAGYATLKDALEKDGNVVVNPVLWNFYQSAEYSKYARSIDATGYKQNEAPYNIYPQAVKDSYVGYGDAAIVTLSRSSGEGTDSSTIDSDGVDGSYLSITQTEQQLLEELTRLKQSGVIEKIVVLLNSALSIQLDFLKYPAIDVDACLWIGNTGSHGAYAVGDILVGKVNPSGSLSDTYLYDNFSSPAMATWAANSKKRFTQSYTNYKELGLNTTNRYYAVYVEGIYVGYRYYETRYEDYVMQSENTGNYDYSAEVAYPFGYGLSYSRFAYDEMQIAENEDGMSYDITLNVSNVSQTPGKETVQLYLQKPYTEYDKTNFIEKASVELVGYAKTDVIPAGETVNVRINVLKEQLKSYDANASQSYILDAGQYYLSAARDAHSAINNILAAKGYSPENGRMDGAGNAAMAKILFNQDSLDTETYSVSSETGNPITNRFDFSDVNRYAGSGSNRVTYVSRSNWTGTFPDAAVSLSVATEQMQTDLKSNNKVEEDGSEMPKFDKNQGLKLIMLRGKDYDDELWNDLLNQMSYAEMSKLITDGYHLTNEVVSVHKPATKDVNGPTSVDGSLTGYCLPCEGIWASSMNDDLIYRIGKLMGDDAVLAGVQGLYAPGINIHRVPFGGRAHEYFSEDPYLSGMASMQEVKGMQSVGVVAYVKHLAFNNEETNRNGVGIWLNEQSAREIYLLPFEYSMRPSMGNAHATMTSFNRAGCIWTSASHQLMLNVIRDEWDFDGFAITDASSGNGAAYMTYYDGIMNGTNLYDGQGTETALDSYKSSARFANRMRESCHRILYVVCNFSAAMNGISTNTRIVPFTPWWQILLITLETVAIVCTVGSAGVYVLSLIPKKGKKNVKADSPL